MCLLTAQSCSQQGSLLYTFRSIAWAVDHESSTKSWPRGRSRCFSRDVFKWPQQNSGAPDDRSRFRKCGNYFKKRIISDNLGVRISFAADGKEWGSTYRSQPLNLGVASAKGSSRFILGRSVDSRIVTSPRLRPIPGQSRHSSPRS